MRFELLATVICCGIGIALTTVGGYYLHRSWNAQQGWCFPNTAYTPDHTGQGYYECFCRHQSNARHNEVLEGTDDERRVKPLGDDHQGHHYKDEGWTTSNGNCNRYELRWPNVIFFTGDGGANDQSAQTCTMTSGYLSNDFASSNANAKCRDRALEMQGQLSLTAVRSQTNSWQPCYKDPNWDSWCYGDDGGDAGGAWMATNAPYIIMVVFGPYLMCCGIAAMVKFCHKRKQSPDREWATAGIGETKNEPISTIEAAPQPQQQGYPQPPQYAAPFNPKPETL